MVLKDNERLPKDATSRFSDFDTKLPLEFEPKTEPIDEYFSGQLFGDQSQSGSFGNGSVLLTCSSKASKLLGSDYGEYDFTGSELESGGRELKAKRNLSLRSAKIPLHERPYKCPRLVINLF